MSKKPRTLKPSSKFVAPARARGSLPLGHTLMEGISTSGVAASEATTGMGTPTSSTHSTAYTLAPPPAPRRVQVGIKDGAKTLSGVNARTPQTPLFLPSLPAELELGPGLVANASPQLLLPFQRLGAGAQGASHFEQEGESIGEAGVGHPPMVASLATPVPEHIAAPAASPDPLPLRMDKKWHRGDFSLVSSDNVIFRVEAARVQATDCTLAGAVTTCVSLIDTPRSISFDQPSPILRPFLSSLLLSRPPGSRGGGRRLPPKDLLRLILFTRSLHASAVLALLTSSLPPYLEPIRQGKEDPWYLFLCAVRLRGWDTAGRVVSVSLSARSRAFAWQRSNVPESEIDTALGCGVGRPSLDPAGWPYALWMEVPKRVSWALVRAYADKSAKEDRGKRFEELMRFVEVRDEIWPSYAALEHDEQDYRAYPASDDEESMVDDSTIYPPDEHEHEGGAEGTEGPNADGPSDSESEEQEQIESPARWLPSTTRGNPPPPALAVGAPSLSPAPAPAPNTTTLNDNGIAIHPPAADQAQAAQVKASRKRSWDDAGLDHIAPAHNHATNLTPQSCSAGNNVLPNDFTDADVALLDDD